MHNVGTFGNGYTPIRTGGGGDTGAQLRAGIIPNLDQTTNSFCFQ